MNNIKYINNNENIIYDVLDYSIVYTDKVFDKKLRGYIKIDLVSKYIENPIFKHCMASIKATSRTF